MEHRENVIDSKRVMRNQVIPIYIYVEKYENFCADVLEIYPILFKIFTWERMYSI